MRNDPVRRIVRERYGQRAREGSACCAGSGGCTGGAQTPVSQAIGYTATQLQSVPAGADLGLGCGNPTALASLQEGDVVVDLGSGAGIDCFLAAQAVSARGRAIGVDMTPDMLDRARENARTHRIENVEFRLGEIENLPVADASVDVVISNCVINLAPDKPRVFREAYRVLKPGGRMIVSDIVLRRELPDAIRNSIEAYVGCVAGALKKDDYLAAVRSAGFHDIRISQETAADTAVSGAGEAQIVVDGRAVQPEELGLSCEGAWELAGAVSSITVEARKPDLRNR
jgi:SAM-dependent methyltransferase